jgi:hypothetical protein
VRDTPARKIFFEPLAAEFYMRRRVCRTSGRRNGSVAVSTASAASCLTWERSSVSVRWRPLLALAIVTHLVTWPLTATGPSLPEDLI